MRKLAPIVVLLAGWLCGPTAHAQTPPSKTVVVRFYEMVGAGQNIIISYGNGKTETIKPEGLVGKKNQQQTTEQLQSIVDRLYNEGYHLVNSTGGGAENGPISTFIFRKE